MDFNRWKVWKSNICCCFCLTLNRHDLDHILCQSWFIHCQSLSVTRAVRRGIMLCSHCAHITQRCTGNCCLSQFICAFLWYQIYVMRRLSFTLQLPNITVKLIRPPGKEMSAGLVMKGQPENFRESKGIAF